MACEGVQAAQATAMALHGSVFQGEYHLFTSPATKIPQAWADHLHGTLPLSTTKSCPKSQQGCPCSAVPRTELQERERKEARKLAMGEHYRRRRKRKLLAHRESVSAALALLPSPGGHAALSIYRGLNAAKVCSTSHQPSSPPAAPVP
jgi:hypothetical protein